MNKKSLEFFVNKGFGNFFGLSIDRKVVST